MIYVILVYVLVVSLLTHYGCAMLSIVSMTSHWYSTITLCWWNWNRMIVRHRLLRISTSRRRCWPAPEGTGARLSVYRSLHCSSYRIRSTCARVLSSYSMRSSGMWVGYVLNTMSMSLYSNSMWIFEYCPIHPTTNSGIVSMISTMSTFNIGVFSITESFSFTNYSNDFLYYGFVFNAFFISISNWDVFSFYLICSYYIEFVFELIEFLG